MEGRKKDVVARTGQEMGLKARAEHGQRVPLNATGVTDACLEAQVLFPEAEVDSNV